MTETEKKIMMSTLDIYQDGRQHLLKDTKEISSDLYLGLYSLKETERENYLDRYLMLWKTGHFENFQRILEHSRERSICKSIFGESYLKFLSYDDYMFCHTEFAVDMFKEYIHILEDMIHTSHSWDQGYDRLCAERKKQEAKFTRLREQMEKENCIEDNL